MKEMTAVLCPECGMDFFTVSKTATCPLKSKGCGKKFNAAAHPIPKVIVGDELKKKVIKVTEKGNKSNKKVIKVTLSNDLAFSIFKKMHLRLYNQLRSKSKLGNTTKDFLDDMDLLKEFLGGILK